MHLKFPMISIKNKEAEAFLTMIIDSCEIQIQNQTPMGSQTNSEFSKARI